MQLLLAVGAFLLQTPVLLVAIAVDVATVVIAAAVAVLFSCFIAVVKTDLK